MGQVELKLISRKKMLKKSKQTAAIAATALAKSAKEDFKVISRQTMIKAKSKQTNHTPNGEVWFKWSLKSQFHEKIHMSGTAQKGLKKYPTATGKKPMKKLTNWLITVSK